MEKVKDSINLMYSRVETLIDQDDQDYNYLAKTQGYKCQFIRDPKMIKFLFEIYYPINKNKGKIKIMMKQNQLKKKANFADQFSMAKNKNDFMQALRVEDILTDDSMKDIDYRDINSDFSDEDRKEVSN